MRCNKVMKSLASSMTVGDAKSRFCVMVPEYDAQRLGISICRSGLYSSIGLSMGLCARPNASYRLGNCARELTRLLGSHGRSRQFDGELGSFTNFRSDADFAAMGFR